MCRSSAEDPKKKFEMEKRTIENKTYTDLLGQLSAEQNARQENNERNIELEKENKEMKYNLAVWYVFYVRVMILVTHYFAFLQSTDTLLYW